MAVGVSNEGFRFRVLGFPVLYRWSALMLPVAFSLLLVQASGIEMVGVIVVFAIAIGLAVLVHELGHALAARHYGGEAAIEIVLTGGLTRHSYATPLGPGKKTVVSAAGTISGLVVGGVMALIEPDLIGAVLQPATAARPIGLVGVGVHIFFLATTYWGVFNLLPLPGLDGAHIFDGLVRMIAPDRAGVIVPVVTAVVAVATIIGFLLWQGLFAAVWLLLLFGRELTRLGERIRIGRDERLIETVTEAEDAYWRGDFQVAADLAARTMNEAVSASVRAAAQSIRGRALDRLGKVDDVLAMEAVTVEAKVNALIRVGRLAEAESILRHASSTPHRQLLLAEVLIRQDLDGRVREILPASGAEALIDRAAGIEATDPGLAKRMAMVALTLPGIRPIDRARAGLLTGAQPDMASLDRPERWAVEAEATARSGSYVIHPPPDSSVGREVLIRLAGSGFWAQALEVARMLGAAVGPQGRVATARSLAGLGRVDDALAELEAAAREGYADAPAIASDAVMAPVIADPRWQPVAAEMGRTATRRAAVR